MAEQLAPAAKRALAVLFVVAVPLLFIAVSVTWAINDLSLYEYGFDRYRVTSVTGIEKADLMTVAREIRSYFNSSTEPLAVTTRVFGEERALFNQKEVVHMHDVKKLVRGVYWVGVGSALFIVGFIASGFYLRRRAFWRTLARLGLFGAGVTVGLTLLVGLMSLVSFDFLFTLFHELSFANDFWQLDPRRASDDVSLRVLVRRRHAGGGTGRAAGGDSCRRRRGSCGVRAMAVPQTGRCFVAFCVILN